MGCSVWRYGVRATKRYHGKLIWVVAVLVGLAGCDVLIGLEDKDFTDTGDSTANAMGGSGAGDAAGGGADSTGGEQQSSDTAKWDEAVWDEALWE